MNAYSLKSLLILALLLTWGWALVEMINQDFPLTTWVAIMIPFMVSSLLIALSRELIPEKKLRSIAKLAQDVRKRIDQSREPIEEKDFPDEIKPLIASINKLFVFQEDRYKQERDFSANASHELRTPLAGIRLQTEIALKAHEEAQRTNALKNVMKAVDRGTRLVEQLLTLSRLTAEEVELAKEAVNLGRVASKTVADLNEMAEKKHITLTMGKWGDTLIEASEESIDILINNLLRNAIIYTPAHGLVHVSVEQKEQTATVSVTDNGPGIPKDKREVVLKRFVKAEQRTKTGTGLGLSIVKRICELHQAELSLDEGPDGAGLKISVTFPLYHDTGIANG